MDFYCFTLLFWKILKAVIFYIALFGCCSGVSENAKNYCTVYTGNKKQIFHFEKVILSDLLQEFARWRELHYWPTL